MRYVLSSLLAIALLASPAAFGADDPSFELSLKDHQFTPAQLTIPAGKKVKLTVKNLDATPAEFESHDFKAEKVIPAGKEGSLFIGPLKPGTYGFFDDFHKSSTTGTLVAE
jgi:plastocyanin